MRLDAGQSACVDASAPETAGFDDLLLAGTRLVFAQAAQKRDPASRNRRESGECRLTTGYAQTAMQSTPTTKILAVRTINPGVERDKVFAILPEEVRDTANLYLDGKIDQWYSQQNGKGGGVHLERH